jgi:high-affinity Fe2+/Pb2+ permease
MFTKLTDTSKSTVFTVLVLLMALATAVMFRAMGVTSEGPTIGLYMSTPAMAALLMLLVVTRDGFSREGWKGLGHERRAASR